MIAVQAFFLPTVLSFIFLVGVPTVLSAVLSFTNFDGYSFKFQFVGLSNYRALFSDPQITASLYFTLLYAVATTVIVTVIAIPLAVMINVHFLGHSLSERLFSSHRCPASWCLPWSGPTSFRRWEVAWSITCCMVCSASGPCNGFRKTT